MSFTNGMLQTMVFHSEYVTLKLAATTNFKHEVELQHVFQYYLYKILLLNLRAHTSLIKINRHSTVHVTGISVVNTNEL